VGFIGKALRRFHCFEKPFNYLYYFFGGLECVGHFFAYVAHFVFLRNVCIRTQRAAVASKRATNLATHLPDPNVVNHIISKTTMIRDFLNYEIVILYLEPLFRGP
jgi:hypothetical protein